MITRFSLAYRCPHDKQNRDWHLTAKTFSTREVAEAAQRIEEDSNGLVWHIFAVELPDLEAK